MALDLWIAFVITYTVISLIPGPSVLMVVSQAISFGTRAALLCIVGDLLGGGFLVGLSLFGVGAILQASALAFQAVKWAGVFYLAYLGYCQIRQAGKPEAVQSQTRSKPIKAGFLTGVLNPKAIVFYMAFLPQFMDANAPVWSQFVILVCTSSVIVGAVLSGYGLLASRVHRVLQGKVQRRFGYLGGGVLIGSSLYVAASR